MKRFANILCVVEPGADNTRALQRAVALADHNQARLTLVSTIEFGYSPHSREFREAIVSEQQEQLARLAAETSTQNVQPAAQLLFGKASIQVIRDVVGNARDLLVKAVARPGLRTIAASDRQLLRKCPCPVWLVHSSDERGYRQILLALDYEPENAENEALNRQLVEMAASLALSEFAQLHVVHAWQFEHEAFFRSVRSGLSRDEVDQMVQAEEARRRGWLEQLVDTWCRPLGADATEYLEPQIHLLTGHAEEVVPACAEDLGAELVVMGTVGRTGIPGFVIGNTAESIVNSLECSLLAVKPAGFVSPVTADDSG